MRKVFLWLLLIFVMVGVYQIGHDAGHAEGFEAGLVAPRPIQKPKSGDILVGKEYASSTITVTADSSHDYVVSMKYKTGAECIAFYVAAGDSVTVGVPASPLYAFFASGTHWYGYGEGLMFGEETTYFKDDSALDFNGFSWEYTLSPVTNGNFHETHISEDDFF